MQGETAVYNKGHARGSKVIHLEFHLFKGDTLRGVTDYR